MSTGLNCMFVERAEGKWYYILEDGWAPKDAFDWLEYAQAYGPFRTKEAALDHLDKHHANPGGFSVYSFRDKNYNERETLKKLLDEAIFREQDRGFPDPIIWIRG